MASTKIEAYCIMLPEQQPCVVWNPHTMTCALLTCNCSTFPPEVKFRHTKPNFTLHVKLVTLLAWLRYNMILFGFTKHIMDLINMAALRIEIESFFHRGPNSAPCSVFPAGFALQSELRTAGVLLQVGFNFCR